MISGCFLAYGFGGIALNVITLWLRDANYLALLTMVITGLAVVPSFVSYVETPRYQYKAGKLSGLIFVLGKMAKRNKKPITKLQLLDQFTDGNKQIT